MNKKSILAMVLLVGTNALATSGADSLDNIDCYAYIQKNAIELQSELQESRNDFSRMSKHQRKARSHEIRQELRQISNQSRVISKIEKLALPPALSESEMQTAKEICDESL